MTKETKITAPNGMFALGMLDTITQAEAGVWCDITLPNGNPAKSPSGVPVRVKVLGTDSATYREALLERTRAAVANSQTKKGDAASRVTDGLAESVDILAKLVIEWEGVEAPTSTKEKPVLVPLNASNIKAMLLGYPVIRDQIDVFVAKQANFLA